MSLFLIWNTVSSQEISFQKEEEKIVELAKNILEGKTDSLRHDASIKLKNVFIKLLNAKKSYLHEFKDLEHISILQPKDKKFKLITWFVPYINGTFEYFGIIQKCNKRGKKCELYFLKDKLELSQNNHNSNLTLNNWYGCLYYDIISIKIKKDTYYTLLGWDGNNETTTKKIIDVLRVDKNQKPNLGADIFNNNKQRIIIEYASKYPISLKYDTELEYIVFDHLEPIDEISIDNFNFYAPNLSYDVFKKTESGWKLEQEIYLNNKK